MNLLDQAISYFSPIRAIKRQAAREVLAYKYAKPDRTRNWRHENRDPNSPVWAGAEGLRSQARAFEQDNDIAKHALDILVNKTIGTGITPEPMVMDTGGEPIVAINDRLAALYEEWSERVDVGHRYSALQAQRLTARTFFRDGEVFLRHLAGTVPNFRHWGRVPYSVELIEPDLIPMDANRPGVTQGIALNEFRQEIAYFVKTHYDADFRVMSNRNLERATVRVERENMEHLAVLDRIAQIRGVSLFATVVGRLGDIGELEESERVAARVAAAFSAVIVKGNADLYIPAQAGEEHRTLKMAPGTIFDDLMPGERVESMPSQRPNTQVVDFRDSQVRAAAGGLGVSYSTLANDFDGSYSAQRQELVESDVNYKVLSEYFVTYAEKPKYRRFVSMAIAAGLVPGWNARNVSRETLSSAVYTPPAMPWVDPTKEMQAIEKELELGINSRMRVQRRRGLSPRDVLRERQLDQQAEATLNPQAEVTAISNQQDGAANG